MTKLQYKVLKAQGDLTQLIIRRNTAALLLVCLFSVAIVSGARIGESSQITTLSTITAIGRIVLSSACYMLSVICLVDVWLSHKKVGCLERKFYELESAADEEMVASLEKSE